jgi:hypothetical protein
MIKTGKRMPITSNPKETPKGFKPTGTALSGVWSEKKINRGKMIKSKDKAYMDYSKQVKKGK